MESQPKGRGRGRARLSLAMSRLSVGRGSAGSAGSSNGTASSSVSPVTAAGSIKSMDSVVQISSSSSSRETTSVTGAVYQFVKKMPMVSLSPRPNYGTAGNLLKLRSNFFELKVDRDEGKVIVNHYRIEMKHDKRTLKRDDLRELFWEMILKQTKFVEHPYDAVFDGGNSFYTLKKIEFPGGSNTYNETIKVTLSTDIRWNSYSIHIRYIGEVCFDTKSDKVISPDSETTNITPIQLVDLILHQYNALPDRYFPGGEKTFADGGRSFYYIPKSNNDLIRLGGPVEAWQGYFASVKHCAMGRTFVNIDTSNGIFFTQQSVLQFLCHSLNAAMKTEQYNTSGLTPEMCLKENERRFFKTEIKGVKVKCNHINNGRVYAVRDVSEQGANEVTFVKRAKDGKEEQSSVAKYFTDVYGGLKYPRLPCLVVGSKSRPVYIPLEKCEIYGPQKMGKKINEEQTSILIKAVCTDAITRQDQIMTVCKKANFPADPFLKNFSIRINPNPECVDGRRISAPRIIFFENRMVDPRDGSWSCDRNRFYMPSSFPQYALLSFVRRDKQHIIQNFCDKLCSNASGLGLKNITMPSVVEYINDPAELEDMFKNFKNKHICFIIVVMERKNSLIYSEVKRVGDVVHGIMTQCLQFKTVQNPKPMTVGNILLKVNAKLNGINSLTGGIPSVEKYLAETELTLVMGIDVTHPGPTDRRSPSIAAVVGNVDTLPSRFTASIVVQKFRREAVVCMNKAVQERIFAFYQNTGKAPRRIIIYRDGVSEGQFNEILGEEVTSIRNACLALSPDFRPKITVVVVQKRHHARFFCTNQQNMCGKAKNIPPGTVVDQTITHGTNFDFYLCSHFGIQGTSRPSHYHVIMDENKFDADEIQSLTYHLCHMYTRCTRSVSIPAPVYYAHLACARAKAHLMNSVGDDNVSTTSGHSGVSVPEDLLTSGCQVATELKDRMYFV